MSEYQGRGETHTYICDAESLENMVRSTLLQPSISKILIGAYLGNRAFWMTRSLNPRWILIPLPRTQRWNRAVVKVVTPHPGDELIIHIGTIFQRLYFALSLHADLLLRTILYPQAIHLFSQYPIMPDTWKIAPISTQRLTWGSSSNNRNTDRRCSTCGIELLTGEKAGFCCGSNGNCYSAVQPLPPLPDEFNAFINSPDISTLSRKLNLIFSFAAMESTHAFPTPGNPSFVAIAGRIYHRVRAGPHDDTAVRWMLYDGFSNTAIPHRSQARDIPSLWIDAVRTSLIHYNPFGSTVFSLWSLRVQQPLQFGSASIIVQDPGCAEIAAVMCYENTLRSQISPRNLLISTVDNNPQRIHTVSRLWEPMAYPLLFPHGTLGWGLRPSI